MAAASGSEEANGFRAAVDFHGGGGVRQQLAGDMEAPATFPPGGALGALRWSVFPGEERTTRVARTTCCFDNGFTPDN